ncbi:MAG: NAD(P)/FAD-dependent oxidoreductase [Halobacteriales archaeon]
MDAVVIGGGIVGLASAYTLAERGANVVLCEKKSLGNGSTERSAGGIRTQFSTPVNVELSQASLETWRTFEAEFGTEIAHRQVGYLFLARSEETASAFEANVAMQHDHGVPSELLTPEEATEYCPGLQPDAFRAATYCGRDGFADPHLALQGYAEAARTAGVDIRTKTPVTDIRTRDGAVVGVDTADGRLDGDVVVNAGGPWARRIASMAGIDVPVAPKRRQVLVVDPETPVPEDVPLTIDLDTGSYFRPERAGAALCGGHFDEPDPDQDPDAYRESFDLEWATTALERAADYTTYFGPASGIKRGWAGLYAVTPDHHPIIEETIPGFIQAIGFSGHGFQHSPATGQLVTELAFDGKASLVDISRLRSERFETGRLIHERNVA